MKKYWYGIGLLVFMLVGYYGSSAMFSTSYDIPTTFASRGEFSISLNENGTIDAVRAVTLSAPRVRGLQITWLAPEGSMVEEGDAVIRFDATKQQADLSDHKSNLKINKAALERARQEHTIQEKQLRLNLEKARRNYDEKKHEAPRVAEEARLELELAELNFDAKLEQLKGDVEKAEVEVARASDKVTLSQRELDQTLINAPIPGLVVYLDLWKGGTMSKVQEGDSPWPGQGLINLPDMDEMMVKTAVSEVDASKVDSGQLVKVTLDAFPGVVYDGYVTSKKTLARPKERGSKINVFDIEVAFKDGDDRLKPGMSAACKIIIEQIDELVSVPLESVFERDGETIVFLKNKKKVAVSVGRRNDMSIEVMSGLEGGEEICLIDPTLDEQILPGERATEPELNKGRQPDKPAGGEVSKKGSGKRGRRGKKRTG